MSSSYRFVLALPAILLASCAAVSTPDGASGPGNPAEPPSALRGESIYRAACVTCHGAKGNGRGPAAAALDPRPRDFTRGMYKWRSTETGALPLDSDIFRTISRGVPGTFMPAWEDLLPERDRRDLVAYLKTFSPRFAEEGIEEDMVVAVPKAPPATPESVARGGKLYEAFKCTQCHGAGGRGDGPAVATLKDDWGRPIRPFDFTSGEYRCGGSDEDIYRTFYTGLNGTPMPSFAASIPEEERWPLVHYIRSLERPKGPIERLLDIDSSWR